MIGILAIALIVICLIMYSIIKDIELLSHLVLIQNKIIHVLANEEIKRKKNKEDKDANTI